MVNKSKLILIISVILVVFGFGIYFIINKSNNDINKNQLNEVKEITKQEALELIKDSYSEENFILEFKEENKKYYIFKVMNSKLKKEEYWVKKSDSTIEHHVIIRDDTILD